jgi:hypothetical protein
LKTAQASNWLGRPLSQAVQKPGKAPWQPKEEAQKPAQEGKLAQAGKPVQEEKAQKPQKQEVAAEPQGLRQEVLV